jgi:glycosyltransferase involved in cell wall biosynthesis
MKISIGTNIKEGPWGGGNLFAINLRNYLESKGHEVLYDLSDDDIDLILITEPRRTSESSAFTHVDVNKYLACVNKKALVVHRINECDERKGTNFVNQYLIEANFISDATVFVSKWLKDLYISQGINQKKNKVILSGANKEIFNSLKFNPWDEKSILKITTHHWGANWNKGFEIYEKLDNLLSQEKYKDRISFTYIGNIPRKFTFNNAKVISPLSGKKLAEEIKKSHLYLTASLNEPSGNHHIEAAQCGLPILYIDSGGIPEYCNGFGLMFNVNNFEEKLDEIIKDYKTHQLKMIKYPFDSLLMCSEYEQLFLELYNSRNEIVEKRVKKISLNFFDRFIYMNSRKLTKLLKR